jgi:hypothetical protein
MDYNQNLTLSMQDVIRHHDLIDTGKLLNSINVYTDLDGLNITIDVKSEDYIKYHLEKYNIVGTLENMTSFKKEIENILSQQYTEILDNLFNNNEDVDFDMDPTITILINGL